MKKLQSYYKKVIRDGKYKQHQHRLIVLDEELEKLEKLHRIGCNCGACLTMKFEIDFLRASLQEWNGNSLG